MCSGESTQTNFICFGFKHTEARIYDIPLSRRAHSTLHHRKGLLNLKIPQVMLCKYWKFHIPSSTVLIWGSLCEEQLVPKVTTSYSVDFMYICYFAYPLVLYVSLSLHMENYRAREKTYFSVMSSSGNFGKSVIEWTLLHFNETSHVRYTHMQNKCFCALLSCLYLHANHVLCIADLNETTVTPKI